MKPDGGIDTMRMTHIKIIHLLEHSHETLLFMFGKKNKRVLNLVNILTLCVIFHVFDYIYGCIELLLIQG